MFQISAKRLNFLRCLLFGLPLAIMGQQQTTQPPHTVRASADASITAKPDRATVSLSVYSQAPTAETASQQDAAATSAVLAALKQAIGSKGQIRTSGFYASPQMQYPKGGGTPKITGYSATNHLTITLEDLGLVSKVLDTAIAAGATQIQGVRFSLKDDETIRAQALAEASRKAYSSAVAIAKSLNLTITGVLEAQTGAPVPVLQQFASLNTGMARAAETVSTPIEPGDIDISVTVTVTLEVR